MNGEDVKKLREVLGLTQDELAQKIGVSRNTIINYERGGVIPESRQQLFASLFEISALEGVDVERIRIENGEAIAKDRNTGATIRGAVVPQRASIPQQEVADVIQMPREVFNQINDLVATVKSQQASIESLTRSVETLSKKGEGADAYGHAAPRAAGE